MSCDKSEIKTKIESKTDSKSDFQIDWPLQERLIEIRENLQKIKQDWDVRYSLEIMIIDCLLTKKTLKELPVKPEFEGAVLPHYSWSMNQNNVYVQCTKFYLFGLSCLFCTDKPNAELAIKCFVQASECYWHDEYDLYDEDGGRLESWDTYYAYTPALNTLGTCYEHGIGVEQNLSEAIRYYSRAGLNHGDTQALHNLSMCLKYCLPVCKMTPQDYLLNFIFPKKDEQPVNLSKYPQNEFDLCRLAAMELTDFNLEIPVYSKYWFNSKSPKPYRRALRELGIRYLFGLDGVTQNDVLAIQYMGKAEVDAKRQAELNALITCHSTTENQFFNPFALVESLLKAAEMDDPMHVNYCLGRMYECSYKNSYKRFYGHSYEQNSELVCSSQNSKIAISSRRAYLHFRKAAISPGAPRILVDTCLAHEVFAVTPILGFSKGVLNLIMDYCGSTRYTEIADVVENEVEYEAEYRENGNKETQVGSSKIEISKNMPCQFL